MGDIVIRYIDMEHTVPAVTQVDSNGDYNVYINARLGYNRQQKAKEHELRHIQEDHFYRNSSVALDEQEADCAGDTDMLAPNTSHVKVTPEKKKRTPRNDFKQMREAAGLTSLQFAKIAGIRQSSYVNYEQGIRPCPAEDEKIILSTFAKLKGTGK